MTDINKIELPILKQSKEIVEAIKNNRVIVIAGEPGSGKSTKLPELCIEAGRGKFKHIAITQPRRIAATSLAQRVAGEKNEIVGNTIGYKIRFDEKISENTSIVYMTDGILLSEMLRDRFFSKYDTIIIDEAHERSLNIDFLLGYLRRIIKKRKDLKVIISSATIDVNLFSKAFDNAPIINVSGKMFPVDVWYRPLDEIKVNSGDITYVNASANIALDIISTEDSGDILIFMPTEQDILETQQILESHNLSNTMVLPLFSRLSKGRQNKIFSNTWKRKIVIATNIAETSITVPGIRYVIDTGLARVKRYSPRLRTNKLPIERIAKANAQQRKGRCGRVAEGLCIRLYDEKDFDSRDEFLSPEIKRSNLADVILKMSAMKLGDAEKFPFIEPPSANIIKDGYALLTELGAINKNRQLTKLGKEMARLPLDPHISRMIIEARRRGVMNDVAIIASGLSIVDPRERPEDKKNEADESQKDFVDTRSDFMVYLNIWNMYQAEWKKLKTQNKMRKFCKKHFLNYNRMREWYDVHHQIKNETRKRTSKNTVMKDSYDAIHKSILSGLLSNVAMCNEKKLYNSIRGKVLTLFPGSTISKKRPAWIVCHEIIETSRVFARTIAQINPIWIEELAPYQCRKTYSNQQFDENSGTVTAFETVLFYGLPIIKNKRIGYGKVRKDEANNIFIQEALINQRLKHNYKFYTKNKTVIKELENYKGKIRDNSLIIDENKIFEFYKKRIPNICSIHDLNKEIKRRNGNDSFLIMKKSDLIAIDIPKTIETYPNYLSVAGGNFALKYAFSPGKENDGITVEIPETSYYKINYDIFGWIIPQLWSEKIEYLLRSLPKTVRKKLAPIKIKANEISSKLKHEPIAFEKAVINVIRDTYGIKIDIKDFKEESLPDHLKIRVNLINSNGKVITTTRNPRTIRIDKNIAYNETNKWKNLTKKYEKYNITSWNINDLDDKIMVYQKDNIPVWGFPCFKDMGDYVNLIVHSNKNIALETHLRGVSKLLQLAINKDLAWEEKDIKINKSIILFFKPFGGWDTVKKSIIQSMRNNFLQIKFNPPMKKIKFENLVNKRKTNMRGVGFKISNIMESTQLYYYQSIKLIEIKKSKSNSMVIDKILNRLKKELDERINYLSSNNLEYKILIQYDRYIKAFFHRVEKASVDPFRDEVRSNLITPFVNTVKKLKKNIKTYPKEKQELILELEEMVEEFTISVFAQQEVRTKYPISEKRLKKKILQIEEY